MPHRYFRVVTSSVTDGDALSNVEDVFVFRTVWCQLLLIGVTVQIEHPNAMERVHQALATSPECWVVNIAVIRYVAEDAGLERAMVYLDSAFLR